MGALPLLAQDVLPEKSRPDRHSGHVSDSEAMQQLMRFVEVSNPMPAGFKGTTENTITDLRMNWSLSGRSFPCSTVRYVSCTSAILMCGGMCYPYIVRRQLEDDFGREAVLDMQVSYRTSGLAQETGAAGLCIT